MKPGDVVLIRFPQTDLQVGKLRPALVVAITPGRYSDVLLALISSRTYQTIPEFDEIVDPSDSDYETSGLKVRSVIRLSRLATVESSVINARLGNISPERIQQLKGRLIGWLQEQA
jgi:mRNA interferase MazF